MTETAATLATDLPVLPDAADEVPPRPVRREIGRGMAFLLLVVVPSMVALGWLLLVASPQYESQAEYVIRGIEAERPAPGGLAELIGGVQLGGNAAREAGVIKDYLLSPDAIAALKASGIDVVALYNRQDVDILSRLRFARPRAETLLDYYRSHIDVDYDKDQGVTHVAVRAFAPGDARTMAQALIQLGEGQVNAFNQRAVNAGIDLARKDMAVAEAEVLSIQGALTNFRDVSGELDPARKGEGEGQQLQGLESQLARERASLASMGRFLSASAPQVQVQASRVAALEAQVGAVRGRMTGAPKALSRQLNAYEQLRLKQDFAAKRYEVARAALESARVQADKQRLFFIAVVKPNLPEKPAKPRPWRDGFAIFVALSAAFAIGWLLLAGIKEHQAD